MEDEIEDGLVVTGGGEISRASINGLLNEVRPVWKGKGLLKRVERLLPVDPSSACQRLLNAAIFDLREKIVTVGIDIAKEIAKTYKLPPVDKDEDILENYSTTNIIDLSYRIGILKRSEWRRVQRCYEIRKDLEHEDNEYTAVLEDCFYIFKSTIEVVLSKDPIEILKVVDVKQVVEAPGQITITEELITDFDRAPELRQEEIIMFLLSISLNESQPEIVKENALELLRHLNTKIKTAVVIKSAKFLEEKLGRNPLSLPYAKIAHSIGATAYFKKAKTKDFYQWLLLTFKQSDGKWGEEGRVATNFHDAGHFIYCPSDLKKQFLKYLVDWYIGDPGGYGQWGHNRPVFFSNAAAPVISRILKYADLNLADDIEKLRDDKAISDRLTNRHILKRFEDLLDITQRLE